MLALDFLLAALVLLSMMHVVGGVVLVARFARRRPRPLQGPAPFVSVLRPVRGVDPDLEEACASVCVQDYAWYEVLFAVQGADDPALPVLQRVQGRFPDRARVAVDSAEHGANAKTSNLINVSRQARGEVLVWNDSRDRVPLHWLSTVVAEIQRGDHPLVTVLCVYREARDLPAAVEAVSWNTDTLPWFLWQEALGGIDFALGSTVALEKATLARIGGLEGVADVLLEDYLLGKRASAAGVPIRFAPVRVDVLHRTDTWSRWWERQRRWLPAYRWTEPLRYSLGALTFGPFWGLALLVLHPESDLALSAFLAPLYLRWCLALWTDEVLVRDAATCRYSWLLPVRDVLYPFVWLAGFFGTNFRWRGLDYRFLRGGVVERISPRTDHGSTAPFRTSA